MFAHDLTRHQLTEALRATARGAYTQEAAYELLIQHGYWLYKTAFRAHIDVEQGDTTTVYASIGTYDKWSGLISDVDHLVGTTGSEYAILRIAASIAADIPVKLRAALTSLDRHDARLVQAAIKHADGDRDAWNDLTGHPSF